MRPQAALEPGIHFQIVLHFYELLPESLIPAVAGIIPWTELVLGTFFILDYAPQPTLKALALLTITYLVILAQVVFRGLSMDHAGCFGGGFLSFTFAQAFIITTLLLLALLKISFSAANNPARA